MMIPSGPLKEIIKLRVLSLIVFLIMAFLAGVLLISAKDNSTRVAGYVCLGVIILLAIFLMVFYVTKEYFEAIITEERNSRKDIVRHWRGLVSTQTRTNQALEESRQQSITQTSSSPTTFNTYEEVQRPDTKII